MKLQTALNRLRLNPLKDTSLPYQWSTAELVDYINDKLDIIYEETGVLEDSETPEICQIIAGVVAANMAKGTNAATIKVAVAFQFVNDDDKLTFPITDNIAMTACSAQAVSTFCRYLICTDADKTVTVQKGDDASTAATAYLPLMTEGLTPIGILLVATDGTHTFTSGTNSLDDTGITATFENSVTSFTLDARVVRINSAEIAGFPNSPDIDIKSKHWMNRNIGTWRSYAASRIQGLIYGKNIREYLIWPPSAYPDQILLTVSRRSLVPLAAAVTTGALTITLDITPSTKTMHRDSGSFITDGFEAGKSFVLSGATDPDNDGTYTIFTVSASSIVTVEAMAGAAQSNGPGTLTTTDVEIELPTQYVKHLYNGVAELAFLKQDLETFDPEKSAEHGRKWLEGLNAIKRDIIRLNQTTETNELPSGVLP